MAIRNNAFSGDTDADRSDRLDLLTANIDSHAGELGVTGDRLTWAQDASAAWLQARSDAITEEGEKENAFEDFQNYVADTVVYYVSAREMLEQIIYEYGGKPDDMLYQYGFKDASPRRYNQLSAKIQAWLDMDAKLRALVPPDPRVAPDAVITELGNRLTAMLTGYQKAYSEKSESDLAFKAKHDLFADDSYQLSILFMAAKLVWGDDDPRLRLLGFCPKSEIWTEHTPPSPKNLTFNEDTFTWDAVEDVDSYQLQYRLTGAVGDWTELYKGVENSFTGRPPDAGEYDFRVRAIAGEDFGRWSSTITVEFV